MIAIAWHFNNKHKDGKFFNPISSHLQNREVVKSTCRNWIALSKCDHFFGSFFLNIENLTLWRNFSRNKSAKLKSFVYNFVGNFKHFFSLCPTLQSSEVTTVSWKINYFPSFLFSREILLFWKERKSQKLNFNVCYFLQEIIFLIVPNWWNGLSDFVFSRCIRLKNGIWKYF